MIKFVMEEPVGVMEPISSAPRNEEEIECFDYNMNPMGVCHFHYMQWLVYEGGEIGYSVVHPWFWWKSEKKYDILL